MKKVFEETQVADMTLKNRIIRSATHEGMADRQGKPTEMLISLYKALAEGEAGAIITGYAGVMPNGKAPFDSMLMIDKDELIDAYRNMVDEVHRYNTPIILQIAHCGRQTSAKITGFPTVAPSAIRDKLYSEDMPLELSEDEIYSIINHFILGIERAKKAGFDGVQLHLAHGYLLSSFLSPHTNKRNDKWGGNTENRFRIIREILTSAREKVGGYPILVKINAYEKSADGIKIEEAVKISQYLEEAGCDAIEVSCGLAEEGFVTPRGEIPFDMLFRYHNKMKKIPKFLYPVVKPGLKLIMASPEPLFLYNLPHAEEIKKHVKIPVIVVGGIRRREDIEAIIEQGKCDFVSMSRPFIMEPHIVRYFKEGKQTESGCINCNYCLAGTAAGPLKCYYGRI